MRAIARMQQWSLATVACSPGLWPPPYGWRLLRISAIKYVPNSIRNLLNFQAILENKTGTKQNQQFLREHWGTKEPGTEGSAGTGHQDSTTLMPYLTLAWMTVVRERSHQTRAWFAVWRKRTPTKQSGMIKIKYRLFLHLKNAHKRKGCRHSRTMMSYLKENIAIKISYERNGVGITNETFQVINIQQQNCKCMSTGR